MGAPTESKRRSSAWLGGSATQSSGLDSAGGVGSGVVIAKDQVLTNAHNARADEVTVTFP